MSTKSSQVQKSFLTKVKKKFQRYIQVDHSELHWLVKTYFHKYSTNSLPTVPPCFLLVPFLPTFNYFQRLLVIFSNFALSNQYNKKIIMAGATSLKRPTEKVSSFLKQLYPPLHVTYNSLLRLLQTIKPEVRYCTQKKKKAAA